MSLSQVLLYTYAREERMMHVYKFCITYVVPPGGHSQLLIYSLPGEAGC